jgi:tetratricopeptide (TPR) repeat protein
LNEHDLVALAGTYRRAKAFDRAAEAASRAIERGAGPEALRARARIAKARGDRAAALRDFSELARSVEDDQVRLELAKLYEHHVKEPLVALDLARRGTGEAESDRARRQARLERKVERQRRLK